MVDNLKAKSILLFLSLFFGFIGVLVKLLYRPWIIGNDINDFGINGFTPNLFYATGICLFASFLVRKRHIQTMIFCTIGILAYETEQLLTSGTFDYLDILATIIGLVIAISIYKLISRKKKFKTVNHSA